MDRNEEQVPEHYIDASAFDPQILDQLRKGIRIPITRDGKPFAVIVPSNQYDVILNLEKRHMHELSELADEDQAGASSHTWEEVKKELAPYLGNKPWGKG